ncbi:ABC transporter permease [Pseudonocardia alaniniphila]|uniref:ABC transporter permease n=1 Tax=Pseudonocardia alaniniphila TaxID=75291 RepID=A0ABS9TD86_9PSEU|nr:ABC transporter permease [Pseudonocardia alaniniphila]MCH6166488.1 ABC transporter permease [Pseudonocardia alaniniphila]
MIGYTLRRLGYGAVVMLLVTVFTFVIMRLVPGDAVSLQLQETGASAEEVAALQAEFGLDQSVWVQLGQWLAGAVRGDLGTSFYGGEPVIDLFMARVPVTVGLGLLAMLVGALIGIALGVVAAVTRGSTTDSAVRIFAVAFLSVPNFVVALLLLTALAIWFAWSPPIVYAGPGEDLGGWLQQIAIPVFALGTGGMAAMARMTRSSMLESLGSDYIRTVRAKGVRERTIVLKHALRNSTIAVLTLLGLELATILGGTVIIEQMFAIPGTGQLVYTAVLDRDYPVVVACTIFYAALFVVTIIVIDLLYALVDPRIRTGRALS